MKKETAAASPSQRDSQEESKTTDGGMGKNGRWGNCENENNH